jgi:DNA-directed RNA polymerase specialized sigma24 family protein
MTEADQAFQRTREGNSRAFADWVRLAEIPLRRSLRRYARLVDVEAVTQEGFLRMWVLAPTLELQGENASLRYAQVLMSNLARGEARRLAREAPLDRDAMEALPDAQVEPDAAPDPFLRRIVLGCLERLPSRPRAAILARIHDGGLRPDRALAQALNMKTNTLLQNIVRARKLLSKCLQAKGVIQEGIR